MNFHFCHTLILGAIGMTFGKAALALGAKGLLAKIFAFLTLLTPFGVVAGEAVDATTLGPLLKTVYSPDRLENLTFGKSRLLQWLNKDKEFSGESLTVPIQFGNPSGGSHDWQSAKDNRTASKYTKFVLDVIDDFDFLRIDHKTLMRARKNIGAFLTAKEPQIDNMLEAAGRRMGIEIYGNGSGKRGRLSATQVLASRILQLETITEAINFEVGDVLQLASDNPAFGSAGVGVRAGEVQVTAVDYDLGQVEVDQNLSAGIATAAQHDYIYIDGDYQAAACGLEAWHPIDAPAANDSFWSVNRSINPTRLAGIRYDGTGDPTLQATAVKFANKVHRLNGQKGIDAIFCPTSFFTALELELGAKTQYYDPGEEEVANIGFAALRINYEGGNVPLVPDFDCPPDRLHALNKKHLTLHSMGDAPSIFDADGTPLLRAADANALDIQTYAYWNLGDNAPGRHGIAEITPQSDYY